MSLSQKENLFSVNEPAASSGPVICLGETFESDHARRRHYLDRLRDYLEALDEHLDGVPFTSVADAAGRLEATGWPMTETQRKKLLAQMASHTDTDADLLHCFKDVIGFPQGAIDDILILSDPPYYTACPNPFLPAFVEHHGTPYDPDKDRYKREPFAADVSEGKRDQLYRAHSYHTKVPHKAIMRYLVHYTEPGDVVLDGFAGSGMTGVAARLCEKPDSKLKTQIEKERKAAGFKAPRWGARTAILNDLGPAATFIAANFTLPFDIKAFRREGERLLTELWDEIGWMYKTRHTDGQMGQIRYAVWSQVHTCPECGGEIVFSEEALDADGRVRKTFACPNCDVNLTKRSLERRFETRIDPASGEPWQRIKLQPYLIEYEIEGERFTKNPDEEDLKTLARIANLPLPDALPTTRFPVEQMYHGSRIEPKGFTHTHHFYLPRPAQALGRLWKMVQAVDDARLRNMLLYFVEQAIWGMSVLNRYSPTHYSQVNRYLSGVYYVASQTSEVSSWYILEGKLSRLLKAFKGVANLNVPAATSTGTAALLPMPDSSVDYIFTDPPFGENIYYADLNFLVESWHRVWTEAAPEAIVDQAKDKRLFDYQHLMQQCFAEYYRVLKPGRWMTVVFHNSHNSVWTAIQEALQHAGFVVADVGTLDKEQGSYRQVTSDATKKDLVISVYKPTHQFELRFGLKAGTEEGAWQFTRQHLEKLPIPRAVNGRMEVLQERTKRLLYDRMVAFHVERDLTPPLSNAEYFAGLEQRFVPRDDMYFLPDQAAEYDQRRAQVQQVQQLELFVQDEASAIEWLRQQLKAKPQTIQDLHPGFTKETAGWSKYEERPELVDLLKYNFIRYDGEGEVPSQIHSYLSSNYKDLRGLPKDHPALQAKAKDRWYVPDPSKAQDLEKVRERNLLKDFEQYRASKSKELKEFRLEAVRAGFAKAWKEKAYQTIIEVGEKIPKQVLQEDPKLIMWYDQAVTRAGATDDALFAG